MSLNYQFSMFSGEFRSKPKINLGGSSQAKSTKSELLLQTQNLRLSRERDRLKPKSACVIQKLWRSYATRRRTMFEIWTLWNFEINKVSSTTSCGRLLCVVRVFNYCSRHLDPKNGLDLLLNHLSKSNPLK